MEVIPAIDIRGGKCVRLYQGDYDRETVYSDDPTRVSARWEALGARRIHVVDLDGAREGKSVNRDAVAAIVSSVSVPVQVGGGIRSLKSATETLSLGVARVIIGTAAVDDLDSVGAICAELGAGRVLASVDARDGRVLTKGWTETSSVAAGELIRQIEAAGLERFVYTDVSRDGTLTAPNMPAIQAMAHSTKMKMLVAGGVSSLDHLVALSRLDIEAAIVGKAVYTGDIDLSKAVEVLGAAAAHAR